MDPITILTALLPAGIDIVKGLGKAVARRIEPKDPTPHNFEEAVKMKELDIQQLKTIAELDSGGDTYPWVEAIRKLQRPFVVASVFMVFLFNVDMINPTFMENLTSSVLFYLFGDRTYSYVKGKK